MVDIANSSSVSGASSARNSTASRANNELDQEAFLKLMTIQLSYQDPFNPVNNSEMLSQMTSMSTSDAINSLSTQMGSLNDVMMSSQALQASSLVGQDVLIPSDTGYLEEGGELSGVVAVGDGKLSNLKVTIKDESGQVIKEFALEGQQQGNVPFSWDGTDKDGEPVKAGKYAVTVHGTSTDGKSETVPALVYGRVDSVTLGSASSPTLVKLKGLGAIALTDILEITGPKQATTNPNPPSSSSSLI